MLPCSSAYGDPSWGPVAFNTFCGIDCISPDVKHEGSASYDAGHHRSDVDSNANVPWALDVLQSGDHIQSASHAAQGRVFNWGKESGRSHKCIPDGFDFF